MENYKVEIKETMSEIIDIEAYSEEEAVKKIEKQYNDKQIILEPCSYREINFKICKNELDITTEDIFKEYNNLTDIQRRNLDYFIIINSIRNCDIKKKLTRKEEYKLFDIVNKTQKKNEEHIDISTIADNIVEAFGNGKISIKVLDEASGGDILDCIIGIGCFDYLEGRYSEKKRNRGGISIVKSKEFINRYKEIIEKYLNEKVKLTYKYEENGNYYYEDENENLYCENGNQNIGEVHLMYCTKDYGEPIRAVEDLERYELVNNPKNDPNYERKEANRYKYMMLDRLRADCDYFLNNGNGFLGHLYYKEVDKHIEEMKKIYNSFSEEEKPEWINLKDIENYQVQMNEMLEKNSEEEI